MTTLDSISQTELGARLKNARMDAGLKQEKVAESLNVTRSTLVAIEQGDRRVKPEELFTLSKLYKVSTNHLLQPQTINATLLGRFRKYKPNEMGKESDDAMHLLNRLAQASVEIESLLGKPLKPYYPPEISLATNDLFSLAEDEAANFRQRLNLGNGPISDLASVLEWEMKIRVFIMPLRGGISGVFAYDDALGACILVNQNHSPKRRYITLAHECGHFISSRSTADIEYEEPPSSSKEEKFAVAFSLALSMPANSLRKRYREICDIEGRFSTRRLILMAAEYNVTSEAMCRRLEGIKLIPSGTYDSLKERGLSKATEQEVLGVTNDEDNSLFYTPTRLSLLAAEAYQKGLLSESQLSEKLGLDRIQVRKFIEPLNKDEYL